MFGFVNYMQTEHSDCGLACVRMVARHYGKKVSMGWLRDNCDASRLGTTIRDLKDMLTGLGLDAVPVSVDMKAARRMPLPAILLWQQHHFVVLYQRSRGYYRIADPARGKVKYAENEFEKLWGASEGAHGVAILAEPGENFDGTELGTVKDHGFTGFLTGHMVKQRSTFALVMILTLLLMGLDAVMPMLLKTTVDDGIALKDVGLVMMCILFQLAAAAGTMASSLANDYILTTAGLKVNHRMVSDYLLKLLHLPQSFFDRKVSSDFIQKIEDQSRIKDFLLSFPQQILTAVISLVVFSWLAWSYSPTVFLMITGLSMIEIGWGALFLQRRKGVDWSVFDHASKIRNNLYELTNGMEELRLNNARHTQFKKWEGLQLGLNALAVKSFWINTFSSGGQQLISKIKTVAITGVSAWFVMEGEMTLGMMMTLGYIAGRLNAPFQTISISLSTVQQARLSFGRLDEVINAAPPVCANEKPRDCSMSLRQVWFKYPGSASPHVLQGIDIDIPEGSVTALVGPSGCGKTTLIKLLTGIYNPSAGSALLGGTDSRALDTDAWLGKCGVVSQNSRIFTDSILANICMSDESPDERLAREALGQAGLQEFVDTLPMGLHTRIGVSGVELSGGQKQRLLIARALYRNPKIIILDEATSSLDAENERRIVENLNRIRAGRTVVIAAHRLSTVRSADRIYYIRDGRATECGTHDELMARRGDYWQLVHRQL